MFIIKERDYPLISTIYQVVGYNELLNNTFGGGEQLFLSKNNRHIYLDLNKDTFECYSIYVLLDACNFSVAKFNYKPAKDVVLFFEKSNNINKILYCEGFELKCYVDFKNKILLFGDLFAQGEHYQFFKDTFCVIEKNEVKLLYIRVNDEILKKITI